MTDQDVLDSCSRILRAILSDDSIVLTMETTRDDVTNWDSFAYVNFIAVVEIELRVKFRVAEVESFENVGAIVRRIKALLSSQYRQS
jgi:acyl carrier protein